MQIPSGYQAVMPYLVLKGAQDFIEFTKSVFDATENTLMRSVRDNGDIMHSEVIVGGCTIMFAEASPQFPVANAGLFTYVDHADDTYKRAMAAGATSIMPPDDKHYGRTCGVIDPLGNTWWITSVKE